MRRQLHDLDRRIVARLDSKVGRHLHLRQAQRPRVGPVRRAQQLPRGLEVVGEVQRSSVGPVRVQPDVDIQEGGGVAGEPAGLEGDGAACRGPVGPVLAETEATA